jgi:hypothetical protein
MDEPINIRIRGTIAMLFGVLATFGLFWLANVLEVFSYRVVAVGPVLAFYGLGAAILGDHVFGTAEGLRNRLYRWSFVLVGALAGWFVAGALGKGQIHVLEASRQAGRERAGKQEHLVSREELDDAVREVTARAAELQRLRAALNTSDATAVSQFDQDVAAYTQRNHEVAELKTKYEARLALEAAFKTALMGTWKYVYDIADDDDHSTTVSRYTTYRPDGHARIEKAAYAGGQAYRAHADAHWELAGNHLRLTVDTASKESGERAGHVREFVLREITDTELHCFDLASGAEIVCLRVSL